MIDEPDPIFDQEAAVEIKLRTLLEAMGLRDGASKDAVALLRQAVADDHARKLDDAQEQAVSVIERAARKKMK